jgi:uncharacterized protein
MADTLRKKLFRAISKSDIKMLRTVLKQGVSAEFQPGDDKPALLEAIDYGRDDIEILDELLAHGADVRAVWRPNPAHSAGATALHWVVGTGRLEVLRWFLNNGANVNAVDERGLTPFNGLIKQFSRLHEDDKNEDDLVSGDVQVLLDAGADLSIPDNEGNTALHCAARFNLQKVAQFLLERGAAVGHKNAEEQTPLHMAVEGGSKEIVEALLAKGANPDETYRSGGSALHWIARQYPDATTDDDRSIAEMLIKHGARVDIANRNESPLCEAAQNGNHGIADILIAHGADLDFHFGRPLRSAVFFEHDDLVEALLKLGAKPDFQEPETLDSTMHVAASERYPKGVKILHQHKANIEICNIDGETPLLVAARRYADDVVQYLVDNGANVNHVDLYGNTPLFWARRTENKEMEELLLKAGAKEPA